MHSLHRPTHLNQPEEFPSSNRSRTAVSADHVYQCHCLQCERSSRQAAHTHTHTNIPESADSLPLRDSHPNRLDIRRLCTWLEKIGTKRTNLALAPARIPSADHASGPRASEGARVGCKRQASRLHLLDHGDLMSTALRPLLRPRSCSRVSKKCTSITTAP